MDRQKRNIIKPVRYQTTPVDEGPKRRKSTAPATIVSGMIDNDIDDIGNTLQQDENSTSFNIQTNITHTDTQHTQSYTNMQTHTNISSYADYAPHVQTHTNTGYTPHVQAHTNTGYTPHLQAHINTGYTPYIQTHTNTHTYTSPVLQEQHTQKHTKFYTDHRVW